MKEGQPNGYQFKHNTRISLDQYRGIASDIMRVNDPVADGFMSRADMRADIQVRTKTSERTRQYDQIGHVRVGKMLEIPKLELFKQGPQQAFKDGSTWVVQVDDQKIGDKVVREDKKGKKFDEEFTVEFQQQLRKGIMECLKKEKLYNGMRMNYPFYLGYLFTTYDISRLISKALTDVGNGVDPLYVTTESVTRMLTNDMISNLLLYVQALANEKLGIADMGSLRDPFIKNNLLDFTLPVIPVDRLARGWVYLKRHGNELIQTTDKTNLNIPDS